MKRPGGNCRKVWLHPTMWPGLHYHNCYRANGHRGPCECGDGELSTETGAIGPFESIVEAYRAMAEMGWRQ